MKPKAGEVWETQCGDITYLVYCYGGRMVQNMQCTVHKDACGGDICYVCGDKFIRRIKAAE